MVPRVELPPLTPFTDQVTVCWVIPEIVAENWTVLEARTYAFGGLIDSSDMDGGGGGELLGELDLEIPPLNMPRPVVKRVAMKTAEARERRLAMGRPLVFIFRTPSEI
jgi:hypothetical protein